MKKIIDYSKEVKRRNLTKKEVYDHFKTLGDNQEEIYNRITAMQEKIREWNISRTITDAVALELQDFIMDLKFYHQIQAGRTTFIGSYKGKLSAEKRKAKSNDWKTMFLDFKKNKKGHLQKLVDAFKSLHPKAPAHVNTYKKYLREK